MSNYQLYQESGLRYSEIDVNLSDLNSKKFASHTQSLRSMFHCGLLTKPTIRQI